jgi:hypothetical protein
MPDTCYESSSRAVSSGRATESNVVLATECSYWVTGVEKELIRRGFTVKSSLELAITLKQSKRTLVEAAREIGADTVLQINTLEFPELVPDTKSLKYFSSNSMGDKLLPTKMGQFQVKKITAFIMDSMKSPHDDATPKRGLVKSGLLDCKVIDANTQDSVYYFNHRVKAENVEGNFLFRYKNYEIYPVKPGKSQGSGSCLVGLFGSSKPTSESETVIFSEEIINPVELQKKKLAEQLSKDFVKYFNQTVNQ